MLDLQYRRVMARRLKVEIDVAARVGYGNGCNICCL